VSLAAIERDLLRHAQAERSRWQDIAQLLLRVDKERLWEGHSTSFSAWVQGMARRADLQESVFWRCLKAGRIYMEFTGSDALDAGVSVSAESLELAEKIQRCAPRPIARQVIERTLDGELSRAELRDVWSTYKPAAGHARGRLPEDPQERAEAIEARKATWESLKRKPENRAEVRRTELIAGFRAAAWLGEFDQARAESRTQGMAGRIAALLVVRRRAEVPERLELHGLWTCVSGPELADLAFNAPASIEFMWLGVSPELSDHARRKAPHMLGILELTRDRGLRVAREAQRRPLQAQARIELLNALLQRAYLWP